MQFVVLIANVGWPAYLVHRSISELGLSCLLVLGGGAQSMRFSRRARVIYQTMESLDHKDDQEVVRIINAAGMDHEVVSVLAADLSAEYLLSRIRHDLSVPVYPIMNEDLLRTLDNKWTFNRLCSDLNLPVPKTLFYSSNPSIKIDEVSHTIGFPLIVKPIVSFGSRGVEVLQDIDSLTGFSHRNSHSNGLIVQEFINGTDWSVGAFAMGGEMCNIVIYESLDPLNTTLSLSRLVIARFRPNQELTAMTGKLIGATKYSGVVNFDLRRRPDGAAFILECNPRFFVRIVASEICGLNFVGAGIPGFSHRQPSVLEHVNYRPWRDALTLEGLRDLAKGSWKARLMLKDFCQVVSNPLPPIYRRFRPE